MRVSPEMRVNRSAFPTCLCLVVNNNCVNPESRSTQVNLVDPSRHATPRMGSAADIFIATESRSPGALVRRMLENIFENSWCCKQLISMIRDCKMSIQVAVEDF